jgi:hypothetical protein
MKALRKLEFSDPSNTMIKFILTFASIASVVVIGSVAFAEPPPSSLESIEWCDLWISHADETNLPRVLLIGDSITRAYYPEVEKRLAGKAYVGRLATSAFISDPMLLKEIAMVLDEYKFDVIHFNNGMHGWQHSEAEYQKAFPGFLAVIKAHAPHARLVWASTTTLKMSPKLPADNLAQATDERVAGRNDIALEYISRAGIDVDDLNSLTRGHPVLHSDNVHFNDQGIALQAAQVAAHVEKLLK